MSKTRKRRSTCAGKSRSQCHKKKKHCKETRRTRKRRSYCRTRKNRRRRMHRRGGRRGGFVQELRTAMVPYGLYRMQKNMQHKHRRRRRHRRGGRRSHRRRR